MREIADLSGPRRLPGLGNALSLRADRMHLTVERWCDRYGPLFRFDIGTQPVLAIADAAVINTVLRDRPEGFRRWRQVQEVLVEMTADGVFTAEGDDWRRQRRIAVTALNADHLNRYYAVIRQATERLHRRLAAAARAGQSIAIDDDFSSYTVDVTSALAFGRDLNTLERGQDELQRDISQIFHMAARRLSIPVPYWRWIRLPADRALDRSVARMATAVGAIVADARARIDERPELVDHPENFLDGMLAAQRTEGRISDRELLGNTLTMLLAGEDTTSHTLAWATWYLAREPAVQERLAGEAIDALGEVPVAPEHGVAAGLRYAEAVLRETLRLKSPAPVMFVEAITDTVIGDVQVPAGCSLLLLTRRAGLSDASFARPLSFDPDRWLTDAEGARDSSAFLAFGAGPRFCPGRNLAFLETKSALAMLARNFEVSLDATAGPVDERFGFTMAPHGLRVRLSERAATPASAALAVHG